jgi:predicted alpha/beta superfamily hydrolase
MLLWFACSGAIDPNSSAPSSLTTSATVVVHYPAGWGHRISLRGSGGGLSWSRGRDLDWSDGDVWTAQIPLSAAVEVKPLYDDSTWAIGPNWTLRPGQTLDLWPHFFHDSGDIQRIDSWHSNVLNNDRGIWVYLPPSYDENPAERYPVVYMHDGQNLFDDDASFIGVSWNVGGALDQGALDASIHEAIVIGVESTDNRTWELTPTDGGEGGGGGEPYLAFLTNELKPWVDSTFRTFGDREHTLMAGSSLGGLISAYIGATHADVFGSVGVLSPSTWWDNLYIINEVANASGRPLRVYLDSGDSGPDNDDVSYTAQLAGSYRSINVPLDYLVQQGGEHSEVYWRQRIPGALAYLLGPR